MKTISRKHKWMRIELIIIKRQIKFCEIIKLMNQENQTQIFKHKFIRDSIKSQNFNANEKFNFSYKRENFSTQSFCLKIVQIWLSKQKFVKIERKFDCPNRKFVLSKKNCVVQTKMILSKQEWIWKFELGNSLEI